MVTGIATPVTTWPDAGNAGAAWLCRRYCHAKVSVTAGPEAVRFVVWLAVGFKVGFMVGVMVWVAVGFVVWLAVGVIVGFVVGSGSWLGWPRGSLCGGRGRAWARARGRGSWPGWTVGPMAGVHDGG